MDQLLTALDLKGIHQPIDHHSMATVIHYKTLHLINTTSLLIFSFTLSNDVALGRILGIPDLLVMGAVEDLVTKLSVYVGAWLSR